MGSGEEFQTQGNLGFSSAVLMELRTQRPAASAQGWHANLGSIPN